MNVLIDRSGNFDPITVTITLKDQNEINDFNDMVCTYEEELQKVNSECRDSKSITDFIKQVKQQINEWL